jgi:6-pyruvoyltetrahydropterin/6-carboxytetrahydropterin synthase
VGEGAEGGMSDYWEIEKEFSFEAAHHLPHHDGKCREQHGHSWKGRITFSGTVLHQSGPKVGMLMDYTDIKQGVQPIVDSYLDHKDLNVSTGLENPTSEELARWLAKKLQLMFGQSIRCITIEETCTSRCRYYPHASR